jgi:hypothetical protein
MPIFSWASLVVQWRTSAVYASCRPHSSKVTIKVMNGFCVLPSLGVRIGKN